MKNSADSELTIPAGTAGPESHFDQGDLLDRAKGKRAAYCLSNGWGVILETKIPD
jgi:hypothetical protein